MAHNRRAHTPYARARRCAWLSENATRAQAPRVPSHAARGWRGSASCRRGPCRSRPWRARQRLRPCACHPPRPQPPRGPGRAGLTLARGDCPSQVTSRSRVFKQSAVGGRRFPSRRSRRGARARAPGPGPPSPPLAARGPQEHGRRRDQRPPRRRPDSPASRQPRTVFASSTSASSRRARSRAAARSTSTSRR
jgi:hypothetical protein